MIVEHGFRIADSFSQAWSVTCWNPLVKSCNKNRRLSLTWYLYGVPWYTGHYEWLKIMWLKKKATGEIHGRKFFQSLLNIQRKHLCSKFLDMLACSSAVLQSFALYISSYWRLIFGPGVSPVLEKTYSTVQEGNT